MSAAAYFEAAIPEPHRILGLKLRPFSLGHYFLLKRFGCEFVSDQAATATRESLIIGVLICSMSHDEFLAFIEQKGFLNEVKRWGNLIGIFDLPAKARQFKAYLDKASDTPEFWIEEDDGLPSGGHWSQAVMTVLMGQLGYSRADALNRPLAQCLADYYKHAESLGVIRLMTEEEIEESSKLQASSFIEDPNLNIQTSNDATLSGLAGFPGDLTQGRPAEHGAGQPRADIKNPFGVSEGAALSEGGENGS